MNNTNPHARLYTRDEFAKLTRDGMYQALLYTSPTLAKGKSRARKEELIELYDAASSDSIPVVKVSEQGPERMEPSDEPPPRVPPEKMAEVNESVDAAIAGAKTHSYENGDPDCVDCGEFGPNTSPDDPCVPRQHVHGPGCDHSETVTASDLPKVAGVEELQRVNPEMPTLELKDGAVFQMAPDPKDLLFTFKDEAHELTEKERALLDSVQKNFKIFCDNPANNDAKRKTKADIYALKVLGIIVNPRFMETLKEGRDHVRDVRRKMRSGVDVGETVREAQKEQKVRDMVREGAESV